MAEALRGVEHIAASRALAGKRNPNNEGLYGYQIRAWRLYLDDCSGKIEDPAVRGAIAAIAALMVLK